jgi:hypothetical protein
MKYINHLALIKAQMQKEERKHRAELAMAQRPQT